MSRPINSRDGYLEALLKHMPTEMTVIYLSVLGIMAASPDTPVWLHWVIFVLCLAATPLWLIFAMKVKTVWQNVLSAVAFVIWAMTLTGGPFSTISGYQEVIGAAFLVVFSAVVAPLVAMAFAKRQPA